MLFVGLGYVIVVIPGIIHLHFSNIPYIIAICTLLAEDIKQGRPKKGAVGQKHGNCTNSV